MHQHHQHHLSPVVPSAEHFSLLALSGTRMDAPWTRGTKPGQALDVVGPEVNPQLIPYPLGPKNEKTPMQFNVIRVKDYSHAIIWVQFRAF